MALTSDPACGSDMAIAVGTPPRAMMGRKRFLCSSEPKCNNGMMNMVFRPASEPQAGETREISSRAMHISVRLPLGPPYCSGTHNCMRPMSPKIGSSSSGKRSVSSISAAIGATCFSTMRRMLSRKASCSSVKFMDRCARFGSCN